MVDPRHISRLITEDPDIPDEYAGLEDNDEFGSSCEYCGDEIPESRSVECAGNCGIQGLVLDICDYCARHHGHERWCNDCWHSSGPGRIWRESTDEYAGLEDNDEFSSTYSTPCNKCNEPVYDEVEEGYYCENCDATWCLSCGDQQNVSIYYCDILTSCPRCNNGPVTENTDEYAGLEDNDEFGRLELYGDVQCPQCAAAHWQGNMANCENCENYVCQRCFDSGETGFIRTEPYENKFICPACTDEFKTNRPPPNMGGPMWPVTEDNDEYAGLEDNDEFENNLFYNLTVHENFVEVFSQYYYSQFDPLYAIVSRAMSSLSLHQEWTDERPADGNDWPKSLIINSDEAYSLKRTCEDIIDYASTHTASRSKKVALNVLQQIEEQE